MQSDDFKILSRGSTYYLNPLSNWAAVTAILYQAYNPLFLSPAGAVCAREVILERELVEGRDHHGGHDCHRLRHADRPLDLGAMSGIRIDAGPGVEVGAAGPGGAQNGDQRRREDEATDHGAPSFGRNLGPPSAGVKAG